MFFFSDTSYFIHLLSFCKKKVTKKNCSVLKSFRFLKPDAVTAPAAPLTVVARRAYPSPGVPPAFLFAVALAHPVVYSHFRILQSKKRKLYEKVWKKMRGCRGRRKEPYKKAGGTPKGFFFSSCNFL